MSNLRETDLYKLLEAVEQGRQYERGLTGYAVSTYRYACDEGLIEAWDEDRRWRLTDLGRAVLEALRDRDRWQRMRDRFKPLADAMVAAVLEQAEKDARPIEQVLQEMAATVPPEEWARVPTNLSERHDNEKEKTADAQDR